MRPWPRALAPAPVRAGALASLALLVALTLAVPGASAQGPSTVAGPTTHPAGLENISVAIVAATFHGSAPFTVHLSANVTGGTGAYAAYAWNLGDGQTAFGTHLTYTFRNEGNYTVQLNVTDNIGDWGLAGVTIVVGAGAAPPPPPIYGTLWFDALLGAGVAAASIAASFFLMRSGRRRTAPSGRSGPGGRPSVVPPGAPRPGAARAPAAAPGASPPMLGPREIGLAAAVPGNGSSTSSAEALRLSQKIILHLGRQGPLQPGEVATMERTQVGLSRRFAASQSSVSNLLQRLTAAGVVTSDSRHVHGHPRRLRVYALTTYGQEIARDLRAKATPDRPAGTFLPPLTATIPAPPAAAPASSGGHALARPVRSSESGPEGVV